MLKGGDMSIQVKYDLNTMLRAMIEQAGHNYDELAAQAETTPSRVLNVKESDWRDEEGILRDNRGRQKATKAINGVEFPILYGDENYSCNEQEKRDLIAKMRRDCFAEGFQDFIKAKFNTLAEDTDEQAAQAALKYAQDFQHKRLGGSGLLFIGAYGVGKTHLAACICNTVVEMGKRCKMTSIENLTDEHYSVNAALKKLCSYSLVVIDDFGAERNTSTAQANTFQVFKRLNEQKISFIVTSNLTMEQVLKPAQKNARVLDRIKHRSLIVQVKGQNRRDVRGSLF